MESAKRIKEIREGLQLTQESFAHLVGVTVSTVNRWENGKSEPHKIIMKTIENLTNTN